MAYNMMARHAHSGMAQTSQISHHARIFCAEKASPDILTQL